MNINILYEDEYILTLDKPSGLMVHSDGRTREATLVDWVNENYPDLKDVGEPQTLQNGEVIKRPGIVHRLDRETSGVIIVVKTKKAHQFLKEQFQNRKVEKIYNAVVWGNFLAGKMEGVINKPIGKSASDFRKWSADLSTRASSVRGKTREAFTEYRVIAQNGEFAYLEVKPKTGRTHQIRVHLKSISHPVVCDKLYASSKICDGSDSCFGFSRLALHALSVKLELPNHTYITIESPLPAEFKNTKNLLKTSEN